MSTYEIDELKEELEGLSIQEKRERLEEMQAEIICEIEELESSLAATSLLLSEVEEEVNNGYNQQIGAALKKVIAAHDNQYPLLPKNDYNEIITENRLPGYVIAGAKYMF